MTDIERAIKHFENVRDGAMVVLDSFGYKPNENPTLYKRRKLNAELAISALEKQIPKKPLEYGENWFTCPNCQTDVFVEVHEDHAHRIVCGQALDWGEII